MQIITSVNNDAIKEYSKLKQKKYRDDSKYFIVEGEKSYHGIVEAGISIKDVFILEQEAEKFCISNSTLVSEPVMKKLCSTDNVPPIVTVAYKPKSNINKFKNYAKIAVFEEIKDPGNLGAIIRSAAAFGIDGIVLLGNCIDIYNAKVIRAAAGNFFKIPIINIDSINELQELFKKHVYISTDVNCSKIKDFENYQNNKSYVLLFGSEANGLSDELKNIADCNITIATEDIVESLNLSIAASIIFYSLYLYN